MNHRPVNVSPASKRGRNRDPVIVAHTDTANSDGGGWGCACARVCACACLRACIHACVCDVFAIYDNNILSRLIMIIIKIIFLNFIEIAQTGDFPSTGTRLIILKLQS